MLAIATTSTSAQEAGGAEWVRELTAYYTSLAYYVPLGGGAIPESRGDDELEIYRELLVHSLKPQVLLLEASVYPMPLLGTWLKRNQRDFYEDAQLRGDINVIESVTAGFPEPAALSLFLGSAMNLVRPGEQRRGTNKGHVGYLLSVGDRHIRDNVLVDDNWYELEWKLKGERQFHDDALSWSFRFGTHQHSHPEIADVVYLGLKRGNLDWRAPFLAFLTNSAAAFKVDVTTDGLALARAQLLIEKRYPLERWGIAIGLETGFVYENNRAYTGSLRDDEDDLLFVLRPNIGF
ncbi:MAG TPA: hypothetical protein VM240_00055 [Verrucomicrobiae bacterium]|nr:hypothetical protein [Verrucomicrobiae bacterium]